MCPPDAPPDAPPPNSFALLDTAFESPTVPTPSKLVAHPAGYRPGKLVIVGSGIKSIAHMTLEAISHIQAADKVFYCIADPATEVYIEKLNSSAFDLCKFYDDGKLRHDTYIQMAEAMLKEVRNGFSVVGCFYGHPGIFAYPTHRAVVIARNEGFEAVMLPGVSAQDCLFADLNVDPSRSGCQTLDATDIVLRNRPLALDCHIIIFQAGYFGEQGFNFNGSRKDKFPTLVKRLLEDYGPCHPIVHYAASTLSFTSPQCDWYTVGDLRSPEVASKITGISTLYLPPKIKLSISQTSADALGFKLDFSKPITTGLFPSGNPYGQRELDVIKALDDHKDPPNYWKTRASPAMYEALYKLALNPKAITQYKSSPERFVSSFIDLTPQENFALAKGQKDLITMTLKTNPLEIAKHCVRAFFRDTSMATQYATICRQNKRTENGKANIATWLKSRGFETTAEDIWTAYQAILEQDLEVFESQYGTRLNRAAGPVILIQNGTVSCAGVVIKQVKYTSNTLSWNAYDGNGSSAILHFQILIDQDDKPLHRGSYIGPRFSGVFYNTGQPIPSSPNFFGQIGSLPSSTLATSIPISAWFGTYSARCKDMREMLKNEDKLILADAGEGNASVTYRGVNVNNFTYENEILSWSKKDGNCQYASVAFTGSPSAGPTKSTAGPHLSGKIWTREGQAPSRPNFWARLSSSEKYADSSPPAFNPMYLKTQGINVAFGAAAIIFGHSVTKALEVFVKWIKDPCQENSAILDRANETSDNANAKLVAIRDQVAQTDPAVGDEPCFEPIQEWEEVFKLDLSGKEGG